MLGIPPTDSPERVAFLAQFWPALWSGVFSSILTGIIVGAILIYWQRSIESRDARRSYSREVSVLRERIREAVAIPDVFTVGNARSAVPPQAEAAMNVARGLPISLWREELTNEGRFLGAVHDFQKAYASFARSAAKFDQALSQFARAFNGARDAIALNDGMVIAYVLGRLQGFAPAGLVPWIGFGMKDVPPHFDEALGLANNDAALKVLNEEYTEARNNLREAVKKLIEQLDA